MKRSKLYTAYLPALFSFLGLLYFQIFCFRKYPDIFVFFAAYLALSYWLIVRRNYKCENFSAVCLRAYLLQLAVVYFSSVAVLILCIFPRDTAVSELSLLQNYRMVFHRCGDIYRLELYDIGVSHGGRILSFTGRRFSFQNYGANRLFGFFFSESICRFSGHRAPLLLLRRILRRCARRDGLRF